MKRCKRHSFKMGFIELVYSINRSCIKIFLFLLRLFFSIHYCCIYYYMKIHLWWAKVNRTLCVCGKIAAHCSLSHFEIKYLNYLRCQEEKIWRVFINLKQLKYFCGRYILACEWKLHLRQNATKWNNKSIRIIT